MISYYIRTYKIIPPLDSMIKSSFDKEVLGLIPGSAVEFFFSGELFHGMHVLVFQYFSVFCTCPVLCCFRGGLCTLMTLSQGRPSNVVLVPICGP